MKSTKQRILQLREIQKGNISANGLNLTLLSDADKNKLNRILARNSVGHDFTKEDLFFIDKLFKSQGL